MIDEFEIEINDETCTVRVDHYMRVPPDPKNTASDWDCMGYVEFEYVVFNGIGAEVEVSDEEDVRILSIYENRLAEND